jgi:hypothetical protein
MIFRLTKKVTLILACVYRNILRKFEDNVPKIGIQSRGIESLIKISGIPGLRIPAILPSFCLIDILIVSLSSLACSGP